MRIIAPASPSGQRVLLRASLRRPQQGACSPWLPAPRGLRIPAQGNALENRHGTTRALMGHRIVPAKTTATFVLCAAPSGRDPWSVPYPGRLPQSGICPGLVCGRAFSAQEPVIIPGQSSLLDAAHVPGEPGVGGRWHASCFRTPPTTDRRWIGGGHHGASSSGPTSADALLSAFGATVMRLGLRVNQVPVPARCPVCSALRWMGATSRIRGP